MKDLLIALNQEEELVVAERNLSKAEFFQCPACRGRVSLKVGQIKRPHFAHYRNQACQSFSEGETREHLEGKLQLASYLKMRETNVQLEAYLPELQQRPDILFEKEHRKIAIEFQCSPISIESVVERTQGYLHANYEVIWVLGNHFTYRNELTAFQKACLYTTSDKKRPILVHYDAAIDYLSVRHDFQLLKNGQTKCLVQQMRLNEQRVLKLTGEKKTSLGRNTFQDFERKHEQFIRQVRYPSVKMQEFLALIYQNKENIVSIPKEIYEILPSEWLIETHPMSWKYQFTLWLESFPIKKILTRKKLQKWLNGRIQTGSIVYYKSPQLAEEFYLQPFLEWIDLLVTREVLKNIGNLKWSYQQSLKRYKNLEEKFKSN